MTRYRLEPTAVQAEALLRHCADARYVWNLCVEQEACWRHGRGRMPGIIERSRQLTEARAENPWLAEGSVIVQQQAIRDHAQAMARLFAGDCRRPRWRRRAEKISTDLARRFDVIRVEDLDIRAMTRSARGTAEAPGRNVAAKAGLNRGILKSGWGLPLRRTHDKAPGRVEKVPAAFTAQCCSACGHVARGSRESQALFRCVACGYACNADVNAARNIAAGHAVKARGGDGAGRPVNREPQLLAP